MAWSGANQSSSPFGGFDFYGNVRENSGNVQNQQSDPSNPTQFATSYLRPGLNLGLSYLSSGTGFTPYQGNRVAGFTGDQNSYFSGVRGSMGSTPGYMQSAQNTVGNVAGSNGMTSGIQGNIDQLNNVASRGATNPYFKDLLDQQLNDIQNRVNASVSGMGRYGSGAHAGTLTKELGNAASRALNDNYFGEQQLQMGALNSALQGGLSAQGQGLQASALAPTMQQAEMSRLRELLQSGSLQQSQNQDEINAARDLYSETQQAPWERLNAYMGVIGQPQSGGYAPAQQQQQQKASTVQRALGGAMTGASLGGMFGQPLLGGLAGGALGLFG